jgi:hypothetical protein
VGSTRAETILPEQVVQDLRPKAGSRRNVRGAPMKTMTVIVLTTLSLLLTGCGNDDDQAKENIKASILDEEQIAGTEVTEEDATCLSDGIVDEIGTDKLQEYGLLNDDLEVKDEVGEVKMEEADADSMADVFVDCVEAEKMLEEQFASMTGSLTPEQQECMKEVLDEEKVKEIMSATFQGDTAGMQSSLQEDFMVCVQPQE